ncbi:hypothetical protein CGCSCA1_v008444 [Colletotrichum siamense]|nr:hypothetical protein CGCSCA1_v008444 [Colletotrichum siamense]
MAFVVIDGSETAIRSTDRLRQHKCHHLPWPAANRRQTPPRTLSSACLATTPRLRHTTFRLQRPQLGSSVVGTLRCRSILLNKRQHELVQYEKIALEWQWFVDSGSGYLVAFCKGDWPFSAEISSWLRSVFLRNPDEPWDTAMLVEKPPAGQKKCQTNVASGKLCSTIAGVLYCLGKPCAECCSPRSTAYIACSQGGRLPNRVRSLT